MAIYEEMKAAGVAANAFTLQSLVRACEDAGEWDKARQLHEEAKSLNLTTTLRDRYSLDGTARPVVRTVFDAFEDDFRTL